MNIAFFTESYKPYLSGVTISAETLAKGLKALGHRVFIFAPYYKDCEKDETDIFRFPSIPSSYPGFRIAIPFSGKIKKLIPTLNLDIIHSHSPFHLGRMGKKYAKKLNIPFVYTFHTLFDQYLHYVPLLPKSLKKKILMDYLRKFCNSSDRVIVPSKPVEELLETLKISSKVDIVPTGIDLELAKKFCGENIRREYGIPDSSPLLLYVGRLTKEKNLLFLFDAFQLIQQKHPDAYLMLVAGGPQEKELKNYANKLGVSKKVVFTGQVKYPKVFDFYSAADVFTFSSTTETQGLVIAEAFSCGLPVVAINASGVKEAVIDSKNGYLTPLDKHAFSEKILQLIRDKEQRKIMSAQALIHVKENFSAKAYAKKIENIYLELKGS